MPGRILIVEDEPPIRRLMRFLLEREGFMVEELADGPSAVEAATANPPDLLILDIMLPGLDGFEVCRRIRAAERGDEHLPVVFVSAKEARLARAALDGLEADGYVCKVNINRELLPAIRSAAAGRA